MRLKELFCFHKWVKNRKIYGKGGSSIYYDKTGERYSFYNCCCEKCGKKKILRVYF